MEREEFEPLVQQAMADWNAGGAAAMVEWLTDDVVVESPPELPGGGTFRGREEVLEFFKTWEPGGGGVRVTFTIAEIIEAGDEFLVMLNATQTGDSSGIDLGEGQFFQIYGLRGQQLARCRIFLEREQAMRAAGLS